MTRTTCPYHQLICDRCGTVFACCDDFCYDWRLLHDALFTGWDTHPDPNRHQYRPACASMSGWQSRAS